MTCKCSEQELLALIRAQTSDSWSDPLHLEVLKSIDKEILKLAIAPHRRSL